MSKNMYKTKLFKCGEELMNEIFNELYYIGEHKYYSLETAQFIENNLCEVRYATVIDVDGHMTAREFNDLYMSFKSAFTTNAEHFFNEKFLDNIDEEAFNDFKSHLSTYLDMYVERGIAHNKAEQDAGNGFKMVR